MTRNKLYVILSTACATGYIWLLINYNQLVIRSGEPGLCLFKRITSFPCPSCGSTRSVISVLKGDLAGALSWNPLGLIILTVLIVVPIWMLTDILLKQDRLFRFYNRAELFMRRKWIAIPAILLVLLNWFWNIYKGL